MSSRKRNSKGTGGTKKPAPSQASKTPAVTSSREQRTNPRKLAAVNPITGQEDKLIFFDPSQVVTKGKGGGGGVGASTRIEEGYAARWLYTPATVLKPADAEDFLLIKTADGEMHRVRGKNICYVAQQDLIGVPDVLQLSDLTEASLLHTLRVRYSKDQVYTSVGPVLVSINPYKWIDGLYSEEAMLRYHGSSAISPRGVSGAGRVAGASGGGGGEGDELSPHLFEVADRAYADLLKVGSGRKSSNQSIIISGESGAGKTEATKIIMRFLARITYRNVSPSRDTEEEGHTARPGQRRTSSGSVVMTKAEGIHVGELEDRVLSCNPLLESFGNARTLRNDNSSRFGKFIKIQFDQGGKIVGAEIQNYLLEKTRLVGQAKNERSYHIFYQLLRGAGAEVLKSLELEGGPKAFKCLRGSNCFNLPGRSDQEEFEETKACLAKIGIDDQGDGSDGANKGGQMHIFQLLAAVLHLLNVAFRPGGEDDGSSGCRVEDSSHAGLKLVANLLGVGAEDLMMALCSKKLMVRGVHTKLDQSPDEAVDKARALAKAIYSQLFLWLVQRINATIAGAKGSSDAWGFIGVLDIYGFEKFDRNSLEQLLINYANEQLQRHFNRHMFEVEQEEYASEGIDWRYINFNDNQPCLDLIDARPGGKPGVLTALDDVQRFKGEEANTKFLAQLKANFGGGSKGPKRGKGAHSLSPVGKWRMSEDDEGKDPEAEGFEGKGEGKGQGKGEGKGEGKGQGKGHPNFVVPRFGDNLFFGILHYAGDVFYDVTGFNDKNSENLSQDIKDLISTSESSLLQDVFAVGGGLSESTSSDDLSPVVGTPSGHSRRGVGGGGRIREASVGAQFKQSLQGLMGTIAATTPRYIRCIKPNLSKVPDALDAVETLRQLKYSGMMEIIRIRQQGFGSRAVHDNFFHKYSLLEPEASDLPGLVGRLSKSLGVSAQDWQIGHTKIFLRRTMSDMLEALVHLRTMGAARIIQRTWKNVRAYRAATCIQVRCSIAYCTVHLMRAYKRKSRKKIGVMMVSWYLGRRLRKSFLEGRAAVVAVQIYLDKDVPLQGCTLTQTYLGTDVPWEGYTPTWMDLEKVVPFYKDDYTLCAELQEKLVDMGAVVKERDIRFPSSESVPVHGGGEGEVTREELDVRVLETQLWLTDAEKEQDFGLCAELQEKLEKLKVMQRDRPTLIELNDWIATTKTDLKAAAARQDFKQAMELQKKLAEMAAKVKALEEAAGNSSGDFQNRQRSGSQSITELQAHLSEAKDAMQSAMKRKEFAKCAQLQAEIAGMEAALDSMPSVTQLAEEIEKAEAALAAATASRDYRTRAELSIKIPKMRDTRSGLLALAVKSMSRKDLRERIQRLEGEMRLAEAEKHFLECSRLQKELEELHEVVDRLPSSGQLEIKISDLQGQMTAAVSAKDFSRAEMLKGEVAKLQLEKNLALEAEAVTQKSHSKSPSKIMENQKAMAATNGKTSDKSKLPLASESQGNTTTQPAEVVTVAVPFTSSKVATVAKVIPTLKVASATPSASGITVVSPRRASMPIPAPTTRVTHALRSTASFHTPATRISGGGEGGKGGDRDDRSVSRLRPKIPVTMQSTVSILEVAKAMSGARTDAALLITTTGGLQGIITSIDLIRRAVSVNMDMTSTMVSSIMTPNPTCVSMDDSAMDALGIMLYRHFRHLPVTGPDGSVTGLLDIAKCLYDAVSRLEKVSERKAAKGEEETKSSQLNDALLQLSKTRGARSSVALQALLSSILPTDSKPTLGTILDSKEPAVFVKSTDSVRAGAKAIAQGRKAVLVVDRGELVGIFSEKDMLNRVIAKELDPDSIMMSDVMTPNPDSVPPDMTVVEGLHQMHENRYLHLPVVSETGRVRGLVSVMEIIQATVGEEGSSGWNAFFGSALDAGDEFSDTASIGSLGSLPSLRCTPSRPAVVGSGGTNPKAGSVKPVMPVGKDKAKDARPVSRLRPKAALIMTVDQTVAEVARSMETAHSDNALLVDRNGALMGIITDNDYARRVVAQRVDPETALVSSVMTPSPFCVGMNDSAMEALGIMIDRHFRHLPVTDSSGAVSSVLSISKCLYDALSRLEHATAKASHSGPKVDQGVAATLLQASITGKGKGSAAALQQFLASLSGDGEPDDPSLGSILDQDVSALCVRPGDSARVAAEAMAEVRKAVLVVEHGNLVGILTPKDMLTRVVAKGLDPDYTLVSEVMTPNPDSVTPDITVIEALHQMHENRYLHLPVVSDTGRVRGLVSVMEIIRAVAGVEGTSRWEAFFGTALDAGDDLSDTASLRSIGTSKHNPNPNPKRTGSMLSVTGTKKEAAKDVRPVSKLRPKAPLIVSTEATSAEVAKAMGGARSDVALLVSSNGSLDGIITDHDIAMKLVAKYLDPNATPVSRVMTPGPQCVNVEDSAMEALGIMMDKRIRHLPVVDGLGRVSGVLSIAKCLYDALSRMERAASKPSSSGPKLDQGMAAALLQASMTGKGKASAAALQQILASLSGEEDPSLASILDQDVSALCVRPGDSTRVAAEAMAEVRKAVLVVEHGNLVGILTPKDMLTRVVAKGLDPDNTLVSEVMTPNPDSVTPDITVIEALQQMHENRFLHLPVVSDTGRIRGLVNVMELVWAVAGTEGSSRWESFFGTALDAGDDFSDTGSLRSMSTNRHYLRGDRTSNRKASMASMSSAKKETPKDIRPVSKLRPKAPLLMTGDKTVGEVARAMLDTHSDSALLVGIDGSLQGIITDNDYARRVIAKRVDPDRALVSSVMTQAPQCVKVEDSAMEALGIMVDKHIRHLPVIDGAGVVTGVLNIGKCLYDAISRLERVAAKTSSAGPKLKPGVAAALLQASVSGNGKLSAPALQHLLTSLSGEDTVCGRL
ncbi:unnamed protein product [Discosporangium mesarthrocarpum]